MVISYSKEKLVELRKASVSTQVPDNVQSRCSRVNSSNPPLWDGMLKNQLRITFDSGTEDVKNGIDNSEEAIIKDEESLEEKRKDLAVKLSVSASIDGSKSSYLLPVFVQRFSEHWLGESLPLLVHKLQYGSILECLKSFPDYIKVVEIPGMIPKIYPVAQESTRLQMDLIDDTYETDFYKSKYGIKRKPSKNEPVSYRQMPSFMHGDYGTDGQRSRNFVRNNRLLLTNFDRQGMPRYSERSFWNSNYNDIQHRHRSVASGAFDRSSTSHGYYPNFEPNARNMRNGSIWDSRINRQSLSPEAYSRRFERPPARLRSNTSMGVYNDMTSNRINHSVNSGNFYSPFATSPVKRSNPNGQKTSVSQNSISEQSISTIKRHLNIDQQRPVNGTEPSTSEHFRSNSPSTRFPSSGWYPATVIRSPNSTNHKTLPISERTVNEFRERTPLSFWNEEAVSEPKLETHLENEVIEQNNEFTQATLIEMLKKEIELNYEIIKDRYKKMAGKELTTKILSGLLNVVAKNPFNAFNKQIPRVFKAEFNSVSQLIISLSKEFLKTSEASVSSPKEAADKTVPLNENSLLFANVRFHEMSRSKQYYFLATELYRQTSCREYVNFETNFDQLLKDNQISIYNKDTAFEMLNILQSYFDEHFAFRFEGTNVYIKAKSENRIPSFDVQKIYNLLCRDEITYKTLEIELDKVEHAEKLTFQSCDKPFYVSLIKYGELYKEIGELFYDLKQVAYEIPRVAKFVKGKSVLAIVTIKGKPCMSRARFIDLLPNNEAQIYLVDEGVEDIVSLHELCELPLCLACFPELAIRVVDQSFKDLTRFMSKEIANKRLKVLFETEQLDVRFKDIYTDNDGQLTYNVTTFSTNLSKSLVDLILQQ